MNRFKQLITQKRGLSLVEVLVSLALLSMIVVLLFSVYMVSLQSIQNNGSLQKQDADAAGQIEKGFGGTFSGESQISENSGEFVIDFNGQRVAADGSYVKGSDEDEDAAFFYFDPK
ncbi:MAG: prepilin-type N-terminal cleavage/methylation domain-containing protein [Oscillospiraceae bacterium]|jgi:prepilin-type N-terminal cleavage/methylation domain-containing protein|nr:prepilin-type N-terminal cleavage/methylation domain-containing protein [Oscillospiraceae bacterium]